MDGASAAWTADTTLPANSTDTGAVGGLAGFTNAGTAISTNLGLYGGVYNNGTTTAARKFASPRGLAVDGSGNVWVSNTAGTYITVTVGVATPTVTPLATGIKNGTLASQP